MDLLERDYYLDQLSGLLRMAMAGQGRTVLISGEAGIGKTTLVEQFVNQSYGAVRQLWGACEALFTPRPLGPLYDIAAQIRGSLATLMDRETDRPALFSALLEELQRGSGPTIVVFEDVHWADEATLDLVKYLGRRILHLPVLFLVTYRDNGLNLHHPLHSVLGDLPGKAVARLKLIPLSESAVIELARQADRPADQLYAVTGGNPFFVTEVLASNAPGVPLMVRDAVCSRVARLSCEARSLLELASVVPNRVERWLLEAILGPATSALEECLSSGMLSLEQKMVAFRHELARQAVESMLSPLRLQTLHGQVLQGLLSQDEETWQAARLVHHALGAQDERRVACYAPLAARQAAAKGSHREAAAQYATALLSASHFSLERRAELLVERGYECYLISQMQEAALAYKQALQIWRELDRVEQIGHALRRLSRIHWFLGQADQAEVYEKEAIQVLETLPPGTDLAMAYSNRAHLLMLASQTDEAVHWGERTIALAESLGDPETLVHALNNVGAALLDAQDGLGRGYLERSLYLALEGGWEEHVSRAYTNLACGEVNNRHYALAESYFQRGLAYCLEHDLDTIELYLRSWLACARFEQGRWDEAAEEATRVLSYYQLPLAAKIPAQAVLGGVRVRRGDPGGMAILNEARDLALATGEIKRIAPVASARAEAAWLRGDMEQCRSEAQVGYDLARNSREAWRLGELSTWMWRAGSLRQPPEQIAKPYALLIAGDWRGSAALWEQIGCPYEQALALAEGDMAAQQEALALFTQLGAQPALAMLRRRLRQQGVAGIPRGPRLSTRANQAGLTNRQLEVLQLMAEDLSNAEIASRLFTSLKTVDHHVSAVLNKLGVRSRTQAIRVAVLMELLPARGQPSTL